MIALVKRLEIIHIVGDNENKKDFQFGAMENVRFLFMKELLKCVYVNICKSFCKKGI